MSQVLADLFGTSATESGSTITINVGDFINKQGQAYLSSPDTATAESKLAAFLAWLHWSQMPATDANGIVAVDKTKAIVPQQSFQPKTFEVREDETQLKTEFGFAVYTVDNTGFDPSQTV